MDSKMKAPFGKWNKRPVENTNCMIKSLIKFVEMKEEGKSSKKISNKKDKYVSRMAEIVTGKSSKCPNTFTNMLEIVSESAKYPSQLLKIYSNLSVFAKETISLLLLILNEFMGLEADPNPLSMSLAPMGDDFIDEILAKPTYKKLLGIFARQPETNQCLLRQEVLQKLAEGVTSEGEAWMEILEQVFISEQHQDVISRYIGDNYADVMGLFKGILKHESKGIQVRGLILLSELLNRCGSVKDFTEKYLEDRENLDLVICLITDESADVKDSAFELLIIYLYTPKDMKSDEVNGLIEENCENLITIIEKDLEVVKEEKQIKQRKEAIEWLTQIHQNM
ncbi:unnamed protein product [Moneuplotes crassus]|uniref:Uncharacterized protein n=1 Tax=Euplotes crassus TaxID=5936 RepID=A0AAD1UEP2_EUPCR|nr:unnamed protein product [Moneuplotes crassus]